MKQLIKLPPSVVDSMRSRLKIENSRVVNLSDFYPEEEDCEINSEDLETNLYFCCGMSCNGGDVYRFMEGRYVDENLNSWDYLDKDCYLAKEFDKQKKITPGKMFYSFEDFLCFSVRGDWYVIRLG